MHLMPAILPTATQNAAASSGWIFYVLIIGMVVLFWFMSRQQKKKQQQAMSFRDQLAPGQDVMTIGRLVGTITEVDGDIITIQTTPSSEFRVMRNGIAQLVEPPAEEDLDLDPGDKADTPNRPDTINLNGKDIPRSQIDGDAGDTKGNPGKEADGDTKR